MPPKAKITREMVVDAAFAIVRETGAESVNARTVAGKLGSSTQPVMYHFATIEALKRAVYEKADCYHTAYLLHTPEAGAERMLGIGLNYIRFAMEEPELFRFLFHSGYAPERSLSEMLDSPALRPILAAMAPEMALRAAQVREVFLTLALFVHGYADILAGNALEYDEETVAAHLKRTYRGAMLAVQEEMP